MILYGASAIPKRMLRLPLQTEITMVALGYFRGAGGRAATHWKGSHVPWILYSANLAFR
jgi:hypothetical protein